MITKIAITLVFVCGLISLCFGMLATTDISAIRSYVFAAAMFAYIPAWKVIIGFDNES